MPLIFFFFFFFCPRTSNTLWTEIRSIDLIDLFLILGGKHLILCAPWRRKWQPTPVFLPGESQGRGEPDGLPSMGSHRVRHDWSDLAQSQWGQTKLKGRCLEQRKVYCRTVQGDRWLISPPNPPSPKLPEVLQQSIFKGKVRKGCPCETLLLNHERRWDSWPPEKNSIQGRDKAWSFRAFV